MSGNNKLRGLGLHLERYGCIYFLVLFWLYYALMMIDTGYVREVVFSYDSSSYFRAAEVIRQGGGFHEDALAGGTGWFSWWPVGYPALIGAVGAVFRDVSIFMCAKILSVIVTGLFLLFLWRAFRNRAWVFALLLLNAGVAEFYRISLSEAVFTPLFFVFVYVLSTIVTEETPKKRSYVSLYFCMTGLFLLRYFGIVATLFAGCVWLMLLAFYLKQRDRVPMKKKLFYFAASGFGAALTEGAYLLMNIRMTGHATGVPRAEFNDKIWELKAQLYEALQQELLNIFSVEHSPLFDSFTIKAQRLLVFAIVAGLVILLVKRKRADRAAVFILAGLFYDIVFIIIRFRSSMDPFNSRFFAPATLLILAGLLQILFETVHGRWLLYAQTATAFLLALGIFSISYGLITDKPAPTAYAQMQEEVLKEYEEIPPRSVILQHEESYRAPYRYFRTDVAFNGTIEAGDTPESLLARYEGYDHICISKRALRKLLASQDVTLTEEMETYLRGMLEQGAPGKEYLLFSGD